MGALSHITWDAVVPLVRSVWPSGTAPGQQEVIEGLVDLLSRLDEPASQWRASVAPVTAPVPPGVERGPVADAPAGSPMRHVMPWLWRPESGGAPMTAAGRENGMELRLSRYRSPLYQPPGGQRHAHARPPSPQVPEGCARVLADEDEDEANFVKAAVNVMRQPGDGDNVLADVLRVREHAGVPRTYHRVEFERREGGGWVMRPQGAPGPSP